MKFSIENFSGGKNDLFDPRQLQPNVEGEPAESPDIENMDITSKGSIITSPGFELVSSLSGGSGGVDNLLVYEKNSTDKYMVLSNGDKHYSVTPSDFTWTLVGDYGTAASRVGGVVYKGSSSTVRAILGTNVTANDVKKWDGTTFASLGGSPPDGYIMESFMGHLFIASGSTLYYSAIANEDNWAGGTISFDNDITGLHAEGEFLQVHTYRTSYTVQFFYNDSFSLSSPLKKPFKNASGCWGQKTLTSVFNDTFYLSQDGIQKFGADPNFIQAGLRINSLSWKITPSLQPANLNMANIDRSCAGFFQKKFYCAVPYSGSSYPSKIFVYNWDYDAWTVRTGFYPSGFGVFPDSNNKDGLYFSSALAPAIYKFNTGYSYDNNSYERKWVSKTFNFGSSLIQKRFNYIDITGAMFTNTTFYVDVDVDGQTVTYKIDNENLLQTASGAYYGDSYYGDMLGGGDLADSFYRYGARIYFTQAIKEGRELIVTVRNSAAGEPFAVDMIQFDFDPMDSVKIPTAAQETTIV